ncbi:MAG TPA: hypothetical protein VHH36_00160 [Candidatus Thermoplasmatota archaeon]|nr:hypothetical protein [Candidatus Thermoplasmatota archaeon]
MWSMPPPLTPQARAALLAAVALVPALSGCLQFSGGSFIVAASAPRAASGMTVFLAQQPGFFDGNAPSAAEYTILYGDKVVYPLGGRGATFNVVDRTGSAFVPYNLFVVGNGDYTVVVRHGDDEMRVRVPVHKWASYVFLHPFDTGDEVRVEAALSSATGGSPESRVLASGELSLQIVYRGLDGEEARPLSHRRVATDHDETSTRIDVERGELSAGPGCYSFEPLFHNAEAKNNLHVKADPTLANQDPPWNWLCITR